MKACGGCATALPLSQFYKDANKPDGLRKKCKACTNAGHRAYVGRNQHRVAEYKKSWYAPRAHEMRQKSRSRYYSNREYHIAGASEWAASNVEKVRRIKAEWKRRNPEYVTADAAKRRAIKLQAIPSWANENAILAIYEAARANSLSVDHIVPLRSPLVCGLHCEANLQLLPLVDNISKNNRHWPDMP